MVHLDTVKQAITERERLKNKNLTVIPIEHLKIIYDALREANGERVEMALLLAGQWIPSEFHDRDQ